MIDTRSRRASEPLNSSNTPWTFIMDLQIDKSFYLYRNLNFNIYLRVTNLFNTKNVVNVFTRSGSASDDGWINSLRAEYTKSNYGPTFEELYNKINIGNGQAYWDLTGNQLFGHPRQILFGVRVAY
jgi:hypothetical protein